MCATAASPRPAGGIEEYQASTDWQEYVERFEFSCFAQGITEDERKKALLLASVGQDAYANIKSVLSPLSPLNVAYKDLLEKLSAQFVPKRSVILNRFKFNQLVQEHDQSAADFIGSIKKLAGTCDFGQSRDSLMRDRLVCGIRDIALQKRLLAEEDKLTFAEAEKLALAAESVSRDVSQLAAGRAGAVPEPEPVHRTDQLIAGRSRPAPGSRSVGPRRVGAAAAGPGERQAGGGPGRAAGEQRAGGPDSAGLDRRRQERQQVCFRCGGQHSPNVCRYRNYRCHTCGVLGHLRRKCRRGSADEIAAHVDESDRAALTDDSFDEQDVCGIYSVGRPKCPPITVEVLIFGVPVQFEVDTGAASTLMSADTF